MSSKEKPLLTTQICIWTDHIKHVLYQHNSFFFLLIFLIDNFFQFFSFNFFFYLFIYFLFVKPLLTNLLQLFSSINKGRQNKECIAVVGYRNLKDLNTPNMRLSGVLFFFSNYCCLRSCKKKKKDLPNW